MNLFTAIILGIIQGIFEWLPISSEAMVTLAGKYLFGQEYSDALTNAIWLHVGTLLSAIVYFRNDLLKLIQALFNKKEDRALLIFLVVSTFATGIIAVPLLFLAFSLQFPEHIFTILIGLFLIFISVLQKKKFEATERELSNKNAFVAGLIQGLAILPGISRSGITVATLLAQKYNLKTAFYLSFLMSIPVTAGAQVVLPLVKDGFEITDVMVVGALSAAITGFVSIKLLLSFAEKVNFSKATFTLGLIIVLIGFLSTLI